MILIIDTSYMLYVKVHHLVARHQMDNSNSFAKNNYFGHLLLIQIR